ncbi:MAG: methyltransferase type 11 [Thermoleophilia bacterium]|nr:methyltransferase type 11 [Thermoleophilia bacterium]
MRGQERKPHDARTMAESFGADAERYDRLRPSYPEPMVEAILADATGREVLDVGCGTGIAARLFQAADCTVLGIDPDQRMADVARQQGLDVEVARFEEWDPAGRTFDVLTSATTWHWIDPPVGALRAADVLRPSGVFAAFWNVQHPPERLAEAFNAVYGRIAQSSPFARYGTDAHARILNRTARGLTDAGAFHTPRVRRFPWEQAYTRTQWLELVPTFGGHGLLSDQQSDELIDGIGAAIDATGGEFTMRYETVLLTATRFGPHGQSGTAATH